jgi:hypothetical protein
LNFDVSKFYDLLHEFEKTNQFYFNVYHPVEGTICALTSCCGVRPYEAVLELCTLYICPKCWGVSSYWGAGNIVILATKEMPEFWRNERLLESLYDSANTEKYYMGTLINELLFYRLAALKALQLIANGETFAPNRRG